MQTDAINDDHIDKSQWVKWTPEDPMVKAQRAEKGDLRIFVDAETGNIREAQATIKNVLNYLWEAGFIDDKQHDEAVTYQIWRDMHQAAMGLRKSISSGDAESFGVKLRAYGYVLLTQRLSRYDQRAIELSVETLASGYTEYLAKKQRQIYRAALDRLALALVPIREQITYLERLSDADREALAEERLKKLLAIIRGNG